MSVRTPRPVTPVGLVAETLRTACQDLADVDGVTPELLRALERARDLAGRLDPYLSECTTPESEALRRLAARTSTEDWDGHNLRHGDASVHLEQEMLSGHVEGQLLAFLVGLTGATRVLEIGMFTGYSALAMAEALPPDGVVVACELDPGVAAVARESFEASPVGDRIEIMVGPAAASLAELAAAPEPFDLMFIDADKGGYLGYVHTVLDEGLLAPGGLVCVDNTLLQGEPYLDVEPGPAGAAIAAFNRAIADDPRVEQVLLPLRDGLTLIRRV